MTIVQTLIHKLLASRRATTADSWTRAGLVHFDIGEGCYTL